MADARFDRGNTVGISLVSLDEDFRRRFEPGAPAYRERIAALERLHTAGCRTLVHIEPYPTPNIVRQEVGPLLEAVAFYRSQGRVVRAFCQQHRIRATIEC
jgi:DNA repair photolyase